MQMQWHALPARSRPILPFSGGLCSAVHRSFPSAKVQKDWILPKVNYTQPAKRRDQAIIRAADTDESDKAEGKVFKTRQELEELQKAFAAVNKAIEEAEAGLGSVQDLPSADLPQEPSRLTRLATVLSRMIAILGLMIASHLFGWPTRILGGLIAGAGMGLLGFRKGSLSGSGSIAAALVGSSTFIASFRASIVLLAFYYTSSKLTSYCEDRKSQDEDFKAGGQRNAIQVLCNALVPTALALASLYYSGGVDLPLVSTFTHARMRMYIALTGGYLGYYGCCCGDTWASEVGQLTKATPRLITTLRPVRKALISTSFVNAATDRTLFYVCSAFILQGTNGGVTRLGLVASGLGGLCVGAAFYVASLMSPSIWRDVLIRKSAIQQILIIPLGLGAGLFGSLLDSLLGATLQFTGYNRKMQKITSKFTEEVTPISGFPFLDNNAVNLVSASLTSILTASLSLSVLVPIQITV